MTGDDLTFEELSEERYYAAVDDCDVGEDCDAVDYGMGSVSGNVSTSTPTITGTVTTNSNYSWNTTASTGSTIKIPISTPVQSQASIFDLVTLGVMQMGTFDATGMATGWIVNQTSLPVEYALFMHSAPVLKLEAGPDFRVFVRGIYSKYLTNERRAAMGLSAI